MELSIIIINRDTPKMSREAVESALRTIKKIEFEVIVVDNSSRAENVLKSFDKRVRVLEGIENKGFGNACNIGVRNSLGKYILFLNSDTILFQDTVDVAFSFFKKQENIGTLGVRQLLENGKLDAGCKRGFPTPLNSLYYFFGLSKIFPKSKRFGAYQQTFIDEKEVVEVDCVSGAFMLIKKEVFNFIGGFDETFFLYGEDVDLCFRLKEAGYRNFYFGKVCFLHYKRSSGKNDIRALESFYDSMKIFYDKHYKKKYPIFVGWIVKFGIFLKKFIAKRKFKRTFVENG